MARIVRSNLNWLTDLINEALGSIDIHPDYGYESKLFKALEDGPYHYFDIAETQLHRGYNDPYEAKERLLISHILSTSSPSIQPSRQPPSGGITV